MWEGGKASPRIGNDRERTKMRKQGPQWSASQRMTPKDNLMIVKMREGCEAWLTLGITLSQKLCSVLNDILTSIDIYYNYMYVCIYVCTMYKKEPHHRG